MANGIEMRKFNRNLVYRVLLSQDEMSKQEIARATAWNPQAAAGLPVSDASEMPAVLWA